MIVALLGIYLLPTFGFDSADSIAGENVAVHKVEESQQQGPDRRQNIGSLAVQRFNQIEKAMDRSRIDELVKSANERVAEIKRRLDPDGDGVIKEEDIARYSWESRRERTRKLYERLRQEGWDIEDLDEKSDEVTYEGDPRRSRSVR